jgi:hypothetical protein
MLLVAYTATLKGYCPPKGYRIKSAYRQQDGRYEVVLEPS